MKTGMGRYRPHIPSGGGGGFVPTDIAGLVAWFDPSDTATITESGGLVSQMNDKSGNTRHLLQATGTKQPGTGVRTLNGLNVLDYDGGDNLAIASTTGVSSPYTCFVVASPDGAGNWNQFVGGLSSWEMVFHSGPSVFSFGVGTWTGLPSITATNPYICELQVNGASTTFCVNDGSRATTSSTTALGRISHGSYGGADDHLNGYVAESIFYDSALSSGDLTTVRDYLNTKWAVY